MGVELEAVPGYEDTLCCGFSFMFKIHMEIHGVK